MCPESKRSLVAVDARRTSAAWSNGIQVCGVCRSTAVRASTRGGREFPLDKETCEMKKIVTLLAVLAVTTLVAIPSFAAPVKGTWGVGYYNPDFPVGARIW